MKYDKYTQQMFLVEVQGCEGLQVADTLYVSWYHPYHGGKHLGVARG